DDPTASHPSNSNNNNNNDERLDLDGGILGLRVQKKKKKRKPAKRLRLETPDETIVSLDKSSFRSVRLAISQAQPRVVCMYFRASVKYNGPDHRRTLSCNASIQSVVCFSYDTQHPVCDMGGPDALRDRKDHTPVSYLQGVVRSLKSYKRTPGKEFFNKTFEALMKKHGIVHFSTASDLKASVIERFNQYAKD
ncbi:hypothetical protein L3Q82_015361, partial [Scortum barcoo]